MEKIQLNPQLTQEDIQTAISRYHYQDTDLPLFFRFMKKCGNIWIRKAIMYSGPDRERIGNRIWKAAGEEAKKKPKKKPGK